MHMYYTIGIVLPSRNVREGRSSVCLGGVPEASGLKVEPIEFMMYGGVSVGIETLGDRCMLWTLSS